MYKINREGEFPFELPVESLDKRIKKLFSEKKIVVYIKNYFDNSTFRYRYYNINQALEDNSDYITTAFLTEELPLIVDYLNKIDLLIFQRTMWDVHVDAFISQVERTEIPMIYDVDDLIISPKYIPIYLNNLGIIEQEDKMFDVHFAFAAKYFSIANRCHGFITTVRYLAEILENDFKRPTWIIKNTLNKEQEHHSKIIRETRKEDQTKYTLGYFSGSPSHKFDLNLIVDELYKLMETYEDIHLKIVGFIEIPPKLLPFKDRVRVAPFVSYEELQYEIGEVDLNLIPLQNSKFNNCKSELKYFEASIVNVISCCSPTSVYKEIITDGENGYICKDGDWFNVIEKIYTNNRAQKVVAENAYKFTLERYGVNNQSYSITKVFSEIIKTIQT